MACFRQRLNPKILIKLGCKSNNKGGSHTVHRNSWIDKFCSNQKKQNGQKLKQLSVVKRPRSSGAVVSELRGLWKWKWVYADGIFCSVSYRSCREDRGHLPSCLSFRRDVTVCVYALQVAEIRRGCWRWWWSMEQALRSNTVSAQPLRTAELYS